MDHHQAADRCHFDKRLTELGGALAQHVPEDVLNGNRPTFERFLKALSNSPLGHVVGHLAESAR